MARAKSERVSGELGTVEFHSRPKTTRPYKGSCAPSARVTGTSITAQASAPTPEQRARRERIEREQRQPERKPPKRGGQALWAEYVGYSRTRDVYGIKVKVRGISAETYWLPYSKAAMMWNEITGENLMEVL